MKKSTTQATPTEPMGIVITMGARTPVEPQVRAYVWGQWSEESSAVSRAEKNQAA